MCARARMKQTHTHTHNGLSTYDTMYTARSSAHLQIFFAARSDLLKHQRRLIRLHHLLLPLLLPPPPLLLLLLLLPPPHLPLPPLPPCHLPILLELRALHYLRSRSAQNQRTQEARQAVRLWSAHHCLGIQIEGAILRSCMRTCMHQKLNPITLASGAGRIATQPIATQPN